MENTVIHCDWTSFGRIKYLGLSFSHCVNEIHVVLRVKFFLFFSFSRSNYEALSLCFLWLSNVNGTVGATLYVSPVYSMPRFSFRHHNILIVHASACLYIRPTHLTIICIVIVEVITEDGGVSIVQSLCRALSDDASGGGSIGAPPVPVPAPPVVP